MTLAIKNPRQFLDHVQEKDSGSILWVKRGIYAYFWLLILEGALRKWVVPQLSAPLLLIRDPIVLFIYWQAYRSGKLKSPDFVFVVAIGIIVTFLAAAQIALGVNDFLTALFGLRSYFLHLPLIFIMKQVLTMRDIKKIGRWVLLIAIPMALLVLAQFRSPESSWLNKGAGQGATQIAFAGEHVRASGTFSYVLGIYDFFPVVSAFLLFAVIKGEYPRWIVIPAAFANLITLPAAGSRTLMFMTAIVAAIAIMLHLRTVQDFARLSRAAVVVTVAGLITAQIPIFKEATTSFEERWTSANEVEGGESGVQGVLAARILGPFLRPFQESSDIPWLGMGIGLGSNFAATMKAGTGSMTGGVGDDNDFLLAEDEWPRVFQEFGPLIGCLFMGFRVYLCVVLVSSAYRSFKHKSGSSLGFLLAITAIPIVGSGVMEQATNLGFMVFLAGLSLAASKTYANQKTPLALASIRQMGRSGRVTL
jgi:hypothetical protein